MSLPIKILSGKNSSTQTIQPAEGLLNITCSLPEQSSLISLRENLRTIAKMEGGAGLDEGLVDLDHVATSIHFML